VLGEQRSSQRCATRSQVRIILVFTSPNTLRDRWGFVNLGQAGDHCRPWLVVTGLGMVELSMAGLTVSRFFAQGVTSHDAVGQSPVA
jgi:hypothetical protein